MKKLFLVLFILWICMGVFNVVYNLGKGVSDYREWGGLTENEKKHKIFGDLNDFLIFIKDNTGNEASILLYSKDARTFYLSMYYLYPRKVLTVNRETSIRQRSAETAYTYIGVYNKEMLFDKYSKVASYAAEGSSDVGYLYKIK